MKTICLTVSIAWMSIASLVNAIERPAPIYLWPEGAPGSVKRMNEPEKEEIGAGKCNVSNIHHPSITPYLVQETSISIHMSPCPAILICPGGGHRVLCLGHEGYDLAEWFAANGIAAFILKNRLAREEGSTYTVDEHAMADTRRALRLIRSRAQEWNVATDKLGVLGFSAGGELAALAAMQSDSGTSAATDPIERNGCRPDFQVLIYPGSSQRFTVEKGMPPVFVALGAKDRDDISLGMANLYLQYKAAGVRAELHIYSNAGHGFGYRPSSKNAAGDWPKRLKEGSSAETVG
ncbi:MAG: alpha/beta hydrolase, partial [Pirellulaceae bacterium]|nr:alpha/beta hydrolase [Pirellulaceae bacterium]